MWASLGRSDEDAQGHAEQDRAQWAFLKGQGRSGREGEREERNEGMISV